MDTLGNPGKIFYIIANVENHTKSITFTFFSHETAGTESGKIRNESAT